VVIVPGVKNVGFVVGGKYGRGFAVCRKDTNTGWGAPAAVRIEGGSFGLQIGASATDLVMLLMDQRSINGLLSSKFTLGGGAEVAAGTGRTERQRADRRDLPGEDPVVLALARGVCRPGADRATLREDLDENKELYGQPVSNKQILDGTVPAPDSASSLLTLLDKYARRES
jgi:lipid-binding SYLF domain-containing protein